MFSPPENRCTQRRLRCFSRRIGSGPVRSWNLQNCHISWSLIAGVALLCANLAVAEDTTGLAAELSKLRSEVEALSQEIEIERAAAREQIEAAAARKAELESEVERENRRLKRLEQSLSEHQKLIQTQVAAESDLQPIVQGQIQTLRAYVLSSLPFQRDSRVTSLDELERALAAGSISPAKAAQRLWSILQDEIRLTKESGLYRQTIRHGDEEQLADVVRLGMVFLYYQVPGGGVGQAVRSKSGWDFVSISDLDDQKRVRTLFDSFQKQVRTGLFEVPVIASRGEGR